MSMKISSSESGNTGLLFVGFNQDAGCFAVGMENGFRIFNSDPLKQKERLDTRGREGSGIGYLEMIFRTNFLGILGGGVNPKIKPNMATVWDDLKKKFIIEFTFTTEVKAIKLRRDRIVLVLENQIKVYTFELHPQQLVQYDTNRNPQGLCALCQSIERGYLAFPHRRAAGHVVIADIVNTKRSLREIKAHDGELAMLTLDAPGYKLATASDKGTLIRVFNTEDGTLLHELRRGSNQATIYSISFNQDSTRLCVSSNHGTIHIFRIEDERASTAGSASGPLAKTSGPPFLPKYFSSHVSDLRCTINSKVKTICAFSSHSPDTLIVLGGDGSYAKYRFTTSGEAVRETFVNFLDFYDDDSDF